MRYGHRTLCGRHRQRVVVVASRPRVGGRPTAPLLTYAASSSSPAVARAVPLCSYCSLRLSLRRTHAHMRMHTCTCTYKWTWTWMVTAAGRAGSCGARPWPVLYRVCGLGLFVHAYDAYASRLVALGAAGVPAAMARLHPCCMHFRLFGSYASSTSFPFHVHAHDNTATEKQCARDARQPCNCTLRKADVLADRSHVSVRRPRRAQVSIRSTLKHLHILSRWALRECRLPLLGCIHAACTFLFRLFGSYLFMHHR